MDIMQKRKIHQCVVLGNVDRDCHICSAHHSRGGACCFGLRWTDGDPECEDCIHCDDCEEETTFRAQTREPRSLIRSNIPNTPTNYSPTPVSVSRTVPIRSSVPIAPVNRPIVVAPGEGVFKRIMKDGTWNGLEGFFRTVHDFFRSSRWQ